MELTIPGAVASAAREFGDAPALADARTGRPWAGRPWAGWAGRLPAELPRAGRAGDRGGRRAHRGGRGAGGPGGHLGAQRLLLGAGRAGRASAGGVLVPVSTRFTGPEALDVISRERRPGAVRGRGFPRCRPAGGAAGRGGCGGRRGRPATAVRGVWRGRSAGHCRAAPRPGRPAARRLGPRGSIRRPLLRGPVPAPAGPGPAEPLPSLRPPRASIRRSSCHAPAPASLSRPARMAGDSD